jgi:hypothetical protein
MFKILSTYICKKKIYKMQHLVGSGPPVLYIGRKVLKGKYVYSKGSASFNSSLCG